MTNYNDGEWHDWFGGDAPVEKNQYVQFYNRQGELYCIKCCYLDWKHLLSTDEDYHTDIIMFRVVETPIYED